MKKIVRLTESDLARIVKRVINEGSEDLAHERLDLLKRIKRFANKVYDLEDSVDLDNEDDTYHLDVCVETADELLKALKRIGEDDDFNDYK